MEEIELVGGPTPGCPVVSGVGIGADGNIFIPERNAVDVLGDLELSTEVSHASANRRNM